MYYGLLMYDLWMAYVRFVYVFRNRLVVTKARNYKLGVRS